MHIDPKIEEPTRKMLGHAIRGEMAELAETIKSVGNGVYVGSISLCVIAAGYVAVELSGRWPTDADLLEIARHAAATSTKYELIQQDVHDYLSRAALAGDRIDAVFPETDVAVTLPLLITAQLLVAFRPGGGKEWWEYLDTIWSAVEAAERADLSLLPALMLRSQRVRAAKKQ